MARNANNKGTDTPVPPAESSDGGTKDNKAAAQAAAAQENQSGKKTLPSQSADTQEGGNKTPQVKATNVDKKDIRKPSWNPTLTRQIKRCFADGVKVLYLTSDNQGFADKDNALAHASTLADGSVKEVSPKDVK